MAETKYDAPAMPQALTELARQDHSLLQTVYQEIADRMGLETAMEVYELFRGQQITFPVRLYDPENIRACVLEQYNGSNIRQLASQYGYSEKTIRRIIKLK